MIRSVRSMRAHARPAVWAAGCLLFAACGGATAAPESEALAAESQPVEVEVGAETPRLPVADPPPVRDVPVDAATDERMRAIASAASRASAGQFASARTDLQQLVSDPVVGGYATYNLGVIAFYEGQPAQATEYFERASQQDPALAEPVAAIVRMELRDGDVTAARRTVDAALARSENAPQIRAVGLYVTLFEGRYEQVIRDAREILLLDDGNLDVHYTLAMANLRLGRMELARYVLEQGLERDASRPDLYFGLAEIEILAENNPGARTWLRRALDADPHHPEAWNNLGLMQLETRAFAEAETSFTNATRYAPDYAEAWLNLGNARKGTGDFAGSQQAFEQALALDRTYADPYFNLGVLYLDAEINGLTPMDRYQAAIGYFNQFRDRAGAISPDHPINEYLAEAQRLYDTELELESMGSGGGEEAFDDFGDDGGGDDWDFGDDGDGGDDWDFGDDGDGGGDDWDFGDDDGGDDWDFGDEETEDEEDSADDSDEEDATEEDGEEADPLGDDPFGDDDFDWGDDDTDPFGE